MNVCLSARQRPVAADDAAHPDAALDHRHRHEHRDVAAGRPAPSHDVHRGAADHPAPDATSRFHVAAQRPARAQTARLPHQSDGDEHVFRIAAVSSERRPVVLGSELVLKQWRPLRDVRGFFPNGDVVLKVRS